MMNDWNPRCFIRDFEGEICLKNDVIVNHYDTLLFNSIQRNVATTVWGFIFTFRIEYIKKRKTIRGDVSLMSLYNQSNKFSFVFVFQDLLDELFGSSFMVLNFNRVYFLSIEYFLLFIMSWLGITLLTLFDSGL